MSMVAKLLSFGVARSLAALLAVLLSAVGGGRLGVEQLTPELADEERSPVTCPVDLTSMPAGQALVQARSHRSRAAYGLMVAVVVLNGLPGDHLAAPSHLIGSAGGPRAPCA